MRGVYQLSYKQFKKNASSFWKDVPHEKSKMKEKIGRKRTPRYIHIHKPFDTGKRTRKKMKCVYMHKWKRKQKDHGKQTLTEFENQLQIILKEINGEVEQKERISVSDCWMNFESELRNMKVHHHVENNTNNEESFLKNHKQSTSTKPESDRRNYTANQSDIPVYIVYRNQSYAMKTRSHLEELKRNIHILTKVPPDLQILFYKGKVLNKYVDFFLEPGDSIRMQVTGKGGMQESSEITPKSTEKDVEFWLKKVVGIPDEIFEQCDSLCILDGETLFSYESEKYLTSETDAPLGIARKILHYRDNTVSCNPNEFTHYTPVQISKFIQDTINNETEITKKFYKSIIDRHIDGFVFSLYRNEKEIENDFADLNIKGIFFRKIILKRNKYLLSTSSISNTPEVNEESKSNVNPQLSAETDQKKIHIGPIFTPPVQEDHPKRTSDSDLSYALTKLLNLVESKSLKYTPCKLNIIHGGWTNANMLEKKFVFFIICENNEFTDKEACGGLWTLISKHMELWLKELPSEERSKFTQSPQNPQSYLYNKDKKVQLSKQCKMACVMEKQLKTILQFDKSILLISKNVLKECCSGYVALLSRNPKQNETFSFSFIKNRKYFLFNPEEYSDGFVLEDIPCTCTGEQTIKEKTEHGIVVSKSVNPVSVESNMHMARHSAGSGEQTFGEETPADLDGQKRILNTGNQDETISKNGPINNSIHHTKDDLKLQKPRDFLKGEADFLTYHAGNRFSQPENDGTLFTRCTEFKSFFSCINKAKENRLVKFQLEVLRFACGCLNSRKNGTIYFGVADSVQDIDGVRYEHGEIVGFQISEMQMDCRSKYTDALKDGISRCFQSNVVPIVDKCVSNPVFVKVFVQNTDIVRFVMEVDIEPSNEKCGKNFFKVNLKKIKNMSNKSVENKDVLFVRRGASTDSLNNQMEQLFIKTELIDNIKYREEHEKSFKLRFLQKETEQPSEKLERLITRGTYRYTKSLWPILVLGKPSDEQKLSDHWKKELSFIKRMHFTAVFDFDDKSNQDGLCSLYRNLERSLLFTGNIFSQHAGNFQELATFLQIPQNVKTVWIFSNGRNDYSETKPHLKRGDWHTSYSAGVCDAVSFFNQTFVIPKNRAVVLVLLFSDDFHGLVDTFNEITKNFGWTPIVIVSEHEQIYAEFCDVIKRECKGRQEQLDAVSVVGMPWHHVNSAITSLTGYDEKINCVVTSSTGSLVSVDERFMDSLDDLDILGANHCENKHFKNKHEKEEFDREQEMQFYKGKHVKWWNFHFQNHVCKRHRFDTLYERINKTLIYAKDETRKVITMTIAHEPGAGGTTLGFHLLWHLRKKYRCSVIKKITDKTVSQIVALWHYKENSSNSISPKPIFLLIDDLVHSEFSFDDLARQLNIEFRNTAPAEGMNCLILFCQREENLDNYGNESLNIFNLKQGLSEEERNWFAGKFDELERKGRETELEEYKPQHLISFMIMRSEFNQEYIKNTIQHLIRDLKISSNEYQLLKFVSFLSAYTPSTRRGIKVFVPLECCDELMGNQIAFWEKTVSSAVSILLLVEQKDLGSGLQVRVAHPMLASALINEVMRKEECRLSDIAVEYLNCSLLKSPSHGRKTLVDFTLEMLKRRLKEEYDDEKTTNFSPLIEEILQQPGERYEMASKVLQLGFALFKDHLIAQTLARLYSKTEKHEEAIKWAKDAIDLSSAYSRTFCLHTYAAVLREKFRFQITSRKQYTVEDSVSHLELVLFTLDIFLEAQKEREIGSDHRWLFPFHDTIHTINEITNFVLNKIHYDSEIKSIIKYLKDENFIPDEIKIIWKRFHVRLKAMHQHGKETLTVLEDDMCFIATFYAQEKISGDSKMFIEHRFYRNLHSRYPKILEQFSQVYGADENEEHKTTTSIQNDAFIRSRLLTLKANSFMNIFNHYTKTIRNKGRKKEISDFLSKLKTYISSIINKDSKDIANLICVDVALALIRGSNRDIENEILQRCKQIVLAEREKVDLGYFFISMLMWPLSETNVHYDNTLFHKALGYLQKNFKERKRPKFQKGTFNFFKEERNISQPTAQFFLANGKGISSLCHRLDIFFKESPDAQFSNTLWDKPITREKLRRLEGKTTRGSAGSNTYIVVQNPYGDPVNIHRIRDPSADKGAISEEEVTFYLGFSIAGPIAYNVKLKRYETSYEEELVSFERGTSFKVDKYLNEDPKELKRLLFKIKVLEKKLPQYLGVREKQLIQDKESIKDALDQLEYNSGQCDITLFE